MSTVLEYQILTGDLSRKCDNLGISAGDSVLGFIITNTVNTNEPLLPGYWLGTMLTILLLRIGGQCTRREERREICLCFYFLTDTYTMSIFLVIWI